jgi:hypothetical protein
VDASATTEHALPNAPRAAVVSIVAVISVWSCFQGLRVCEPWTENFTLQN